MQAAALEVVVADLAVVVHREAVEVALSLAAHEVVVAVEEADSFDMYEG